MMITCMICFNKFEPNEETLKAYKNGCTYCCRECSSVSNQAEWEQRYKVGFHNCSKSR
jgi:hypothetical protein